MASSPLRYRPGTAKGPLLSAGAMVVRSTGDGWRLLLLRAYNHWDAPKGLVEANEEPLEAARREVAEETLILDLRFPWGLDYRETGPYGKSPGKVARYYLAETSEQEVFLPYSSEIGRPEHEEYRWVTFAEARKLVSARVLPVIDWAYGRVVEGRP